MDVCGSAFLQSLWCGGTASHKNFYGVSNMQKVNFSLKGLRADEMSIRLNAVRPQNGGKMELKPTFSRKVRRAVENDKLCFITLTVKIEKTDDSPKPFDLNVTFTGVFESEAATDEERRAVVVEGTALLYPYLRAAVTTLTTAAMAAPVVLPVINGPLFAEDRDKEGIVS